MGLPYIKSLEPKFMSPKKRGNTKKVIIKYSNIINIKIFNIIDNSFKVSLNKS